jgi:hypothetical protein
MGLDIRLPIGALFTLLGLILATYGMFADAASTARSLGHNVNLWWGLVILAVGLLFLALARRGASAVHSSP